MINMKLHPEKVIVPPWRTPAPNDAKSTLHKSIVAKGMLSPILVDPEFQVIDGVRRLLVAEALGWEEVEVVVPDGYDEAADVLRATKDTEPTTMEKITPLRVGQFHDSLKYLEEERAQERMEAMRGRPKNSGYKTFYSHRGPVSVVLKKALDLPNPSWVQIIKRFQTMSRQPGPNRELAAQAWAEVCEGQITVHAAYGRFRRVLEKRRKFDHGTNQKVMFTGMVPVADVLIQSMTSIGDIDADITVEEAKVWAEKLRQLRAAVHYAQRRLLTKVNEESEE